MGSYKDTIRELRQSNAALWAAIEALERKLDVKTGDTTSKLLRGLLELRGDEPTLEFNETDQTDPDGRYRLQGTAASFGIQGATAAGWAAIKWLLIYNHLNKYTELSTLDTDWALALRPKSADAGEKSEILIGSKDANPSGIQLNTGNNSGSRVIRFFLGNAAAVVTGQWASVEHTGFKARDFQLGSVSELTISGGQISVVHSALRSFHFIDTQSDDPSDDLDSIITTSSSLDSSDRGRMLLIRAAHTDRTVVVKHGTGNIVFSDETDRILDSTSKMIQLWWTGANWTDTAGGAKWWHEHDLSVSSLSKGASGATEVVADANTLGGWQLNAVGELVNFGAHMEDIWDAVSDLQINVWFEVNVDNTGGADADTVDLKIVARYKGDGETVIKTQTVEVATTVGKSARYKQFKATVAIDYVAGGNVIDALDVFSFVMNLETDTSEVDDIIVNLVELRYETKKPALEV